MSGIPKTAVREELASQDIPCRAGQVTPEGFSGRFRKFTIREEPWTNNAGIICSMGVQD
jgi:hypothetical protein